ncbi:hypothetical protein RYH80_00445 [Halobaculum sp. MBLA0147]|uniref:hypothetical protein n=1 Tax=Halobaculum sp. MBLA0147 TaxID=3079934 RepID=UPI003523DAB9
MTAGLRAVTLAWLLVGGTVAGVALGSGVVTPSAADGGTTPTTVGNDTPTPTAAGNTPTAVVSVRPVRPFDGRRLGLHASDSTAGSDAEIETATWTLTTPDGRRLTRTGTRTSVVPRRAGTVEVRLTVTDTAGRTATATRRVEFVRTAISVTSAAGNTPANTSVVLVPGDRVGAGVYPTGSDGTVRLLLPAGRAYGVVTLQDDHRATPLVPEAGPPDGVPDIYPVGNLTARAGRHRHVTLPSGDPVAVHARDEDGRRLAIRQPDDDETGATDATDVATTDRGDTTDEDAPVRLSVRVGGARVFAGADGDDGGGWSGAETADGPRPVVGGPVGLGHLHTTDDGRLSADGTQPLEFAGAVTLGVTPTSERFRDPGVVRRLTVGVTNRTTATVRLATVATSETPDESSETATPASTQSPTPVSTTTATATSEPTATASRTFTPTTTATPTPEHTVTPATAEPTDRPATPDETVAATPTSTPDPDETGGTEPDAETDTPEPDAETDTPTPRDRTPTLDEHTGTASEPTTRTPGLSDGSRVVSTSPRSQTSVDEVTTPTGEAVTPTPRVTDPTTAVELPPTADDPRSTPTASRDTDDGGPWSERDDETGLDGTDGGLPLLGLLVLVLLLVFPGLARLAGED